MASITLEKKFNVITNMLTLLGIDKYSGNLSELSGAARDLDNANIVFALSAACDDVIVELDAIKRCIALNVKNL